MGSKTARAKSGGTAKAHAKQAAARSAREKARKKREAEAFLATDEGKAALERQKKEAVEGQARDVAGKILEHAHRRVFERTLAVEVARWAHGPLEELLAIAPEIHQRANKLSEREGVALRRVALEVEEVVGVVRQQLEHAAKQKEQQEKEAPGDAEVVAVRVSVMRRACVLALANVFARVTVVELGGGPWPFDVAPESPAESTPAEVSIDTQQETVVPNEAADEMPGTVREHGLQPALRESDALAVDDASAVVADALGGMADDYRVVPSPQEGAQP